VTLVPKVAPSNLRVLICDGVQGGRRAARAGNADRYQSPTDLMAGMRQDDPRRPGGAVAAWAEAPDHHTREDAAFTVLAAEPEHVRATDASPSVLKLLGNVFSCLDLGLDDLKVWVQVCVGVWSGATKMEPLGFVT
jgi:hypothetical protein